MQRQPQFMRAIEARGPPDPLFAGRRHVEDWRPLMAYWQSPYCGKRNTLSSAETARRRRERSKTAHDQHAGL